MARPCYRNIDKPIVVLGLEYQDWLMVIAFFALFIIFPYLSNTTVLALTAMVWGILRAVKINKPPGYLQHVLYRAGMPLPWLLPPPRTIPRYSAFPAQSATLVWRRKGEDVS